MRILYVSSVLAEDDSIRAELAALDPSLDVQSVAGAAAALVAIRSDADYRAVFLSPHLPNNEALALIATLRRDRAPVAMVAIITDDQRQFFAPAITAGADDVLLVGASGFLTADETLRRVRHSRHLPRPEGQHPLRVLFAGQDDLAWDLLQDMPFVVAERATADADGTCRTAMTGQTGQPAADVIIVDEQPGEGHTLQVVKWLRAHAPAIPLVVLTSPSGTDVGGAALDLGADDVVSKAGTYRRRLVATLHRHYLRKVIGSEGSEGSGGSGGSEGAGGSGGSEGAGGSGGSGGFAVRDEAPAEEILPEPFEVGGDEAPLEPMEFEEPARRLEPSEDEEIAHIRAAIAMETRIRDLTAEVQALSAALDAKGHAFGELQEAQGFERAMRERDREELTRLRQALAEERERRIVLEGTLRHTEDRAAAELAALDASHSAAQRQLREQLAAAADRLHQVANETQVLQTHLQNELTTQAAERDRLVQTDLFGYAAVDTNGTVVRCNAAFAEMFGLDNVEDVLTGEPFAGLADHGHVVGQLEHGVRVNRVESVMRRTTGQAFRVVTSAALLPPEDGGRQLVERVLIDVDDRTRLEEQLRLARRLESAGRLAAEMSSEIDPLLAAIDDPAAPAGDRRRAAMLVRQLLAFSRRQAKPAGLLSLYDAIARAEPLLRRIAGDGMTLDLRIADVGTVAAGDDDVEQLLAALVFTAAGSLPYGGTITLETRTIRSGFDQHTELTIGAGGYGVHPAHVSSSLALHVSRCGGTVRVTDEPARTTALHVHLPS